MDELKRVFICLPVSDEVVKEIAGIQEKLGKKLQFIGKATELENLHLTLKFLGEISADTLEKVKERLNGINFTEIKLKLGHVGAFSYKNQPRIVWIKVLGDAARMQRLVDNALADLFPKEERFMSHMTIARIKYVKDIKYAKEYIKGLRLSPIAWTSDKILLNESMLKPDGPIYKTVEEYKSKI